jgi:uncharacterized protein (DUF3084 family)
MPSSATRRCGYAISSPPVSPRSLPISTGHCNESGSSIHRPVHKGRRWSCRTVVSMSPSIDFSYY